MKINITEGNMSYQEDGSTRAVCQDGSLFQTSLQASMANSIANNIENSIENKEIRMAKERSSSIASIEAAGKVSHLPEGIGGYTAQRATMEAQAAVRTEVTFLSYAQADKVKLDILNGYAMKGKLLQDEGSGTTGVYIEIKHDDGYVEAYTVDTSRIKEDTTDSVEQLALEIERQRKGERE